MGKLRGFLEYDRIKEETIAPKERIGNYKEFTIAPKTDQKGITLEWKAREPKPIGKGKVTVTKIKELPFVSIKSAKVIIK